MIKSTSLFSQTTANSLRQLDATTKQIHEAQKELSSGKVTDLSKNPMGSALGQLATSRIRDYQSSNFQCLEGGTACQRIISSMDEVLDILNSQLRLTIQANSDVMDADAKRDLDNQLQTSITAMDRILSNVTWNDVSILTDKYVFPANTACGLFFKAKANNYQTDTFSLGAGTTAVTGLSDVCGVLNGDIQASSSKGNIISIKIGSSTLTGDTSQIGANNLFTLTDTNNPMNRLTFAVGSTSATDVSSGINSILGGMTIKPNVFNLANNALFTGGIDYTQTTGNYSGTVQSCSVGVSGTNYIVNLVIADGDESQIYTATVTPPFVADSKLILTSTTNTNNKIAFSLSSTIPTGITQQTLYNDFSNLLGLSNGTPAQFKAQNVPAYNGVSIIADQGISSCDNQISYTYSALNNQGTFTLTDGAGQTHTLLVSFPVEKTDILKFGNGVNINIDTALFDKTTNKGSMSFELKNHQLYFQTGISSSDQLKIDCPDLSLKKLGLDSMNLLNKNNAIAANQVIKKAIETIIRQNGIISQMSQKISSQEVLNGDNTLTFEDVYEKNLGVNITKIATENALYEAFRDINLSIIANEPVYQEKLKRLLDNLG